MEERAATVDLVIGGEKFSFSLTDELQIDRHDLDHELARQAAHFAWFGVLRERARAERMRLEAELEDRENDLYIEASGTGSKVTDTKAKVRSNTEVRGLIRKITRAEQDERMLSMIVDALTQRKDMLISLARSRHLEMSAPSSDEVERIKKNLLGR